MIHQWLQPGLPGYLVGLAGSAILISGLAWLVGLLIQRARTEIRLVAVVSTLVVLALLPALVYFGSNLNFGVIEATPASPTPLFQQSESLSPGVSGLQSGPFSTMAGAFSSVQGTDSEWGMSQWIGAAWLAFAGLFTLVACIRQLSLYQWLKQRATNVAGHVFSADVQVPFCGGIIRPFVVVPNVFEELGAAERTAILAHEEAHLQFRHPAQAFLSEICAAIFGWIPFVFFLRRQLDHLQERQCDEAVLRQGGDGVALAKSLVFFAERTHLQARMQSTLSIIAIKSTLQDRVERLTGTGGLPMQPKKLTLGILSIALASLSISLAVAMQVRANPIEETKRFLPYQSGKIWNYRYSNNDGKTGEMRVRATSVQPNKPYPVMEFVRAQETYTVYDYWMATPEGLVPVDNRAMMGPGFATDRKRGAHLPANAKPGMKWTWREQFRGQTMAGPNGEPSAPPPPTTYVGQVVSIDQEVRVPFGTIVATVVEIKTIANYPWTERAYWARNVGLVKREILDENGVATRTEELVSVTQEKD